MKILNLYAGIGGNRKHWDDCSITAVELNPEIARVYQDLYTDDTVIVGDAHEYLLEHFQEFDFIWASPPCQSHSQIRINIGFRAKRKYDSVKPIYPDMKLYQEIILLQNWFDGDFVVENTTPYYEPLIPGQKMAGHIWWRSFPIPNFKIENRGHRDGTVESLQILKGIDLSKYDISDKRQILRNCVEPETGQYIYEFLKNNKTVKTEQIGMF